MKCDCNWCHNEREIVFIGGYNLCANCLIIHDQRTIEDWILSLGLKIPLLKVQQHLLDMFGGGTYSFGDFPKLYSRYNRGPMDDDGWYEIPQKEYVQNAFSDHVKKLAIRSH